VWRKDGQEPRQRSSDAVIEEIVELRRMGYRFIALADDNFYPVTLADIALAERQSNTSRVVDLRRLRRERLEFLDRLADLPPDTILFTQVTMEAAEDPAFLEAMRRARMSAVIRKRSYWDARRWGRSGLAQFEVEVIEITFRRMQAALGKTSFHSLRGRLVVGITDFRS
jgi:hypothetical protein